MTVSVITGLLIQAAALWLMHVGIRGQWMRHIGAIFLATSVCYHGLTEVMQSMWPDGRNSYRSLIGQEALDNWLPVVSLALFALTATYVAVIRRTDDEQTPEPASSASYLDRLRLPYLLAVAVPLVGLTVVGSSAVSFSEDGAAASGSDYIVGGLSGQYMILLAGIAGTVAIAKFGPKRLLRILMVEAGVLSLAGNRRSIVFAVLITLYGLSMCRIRVPRRQLALGLAAAVLLVGSISASRAVLGRQEFFAGSGASDRSNAVAAGGGALATDQGWQAIADDTVYRLDGNTFGAIILSGIDSGVEPVGRQTLVDGARMMIPSVIYPAKLDMPLTARNEETALALRFITVTDDFIPGFMGSAIAYWGRIGLLIIALLAGVLLAVADRWALRKANPVRLLVGAGLVLGVLVYEQGLPGLMGATRAAVVLGIAMTLLLRFVKEPAAKPAPVQPVPSVVLSRAAHYPPLRGARGQK